MFKHTSLLATGFLALATAFAFAPSHLAGQDDPVVQKIIELGTTDNQVMKWADYATNRFGGRLTGSDAYTNATEWALWQFREWGLEAGLKAEQRLYKALSLYGQVGWEKLLDARYPHTAIAAVGLTIGF